MVIWSILAKFGFAIDLDNFDQIWIFDQFSHLINVIRFDGMTSRREKHVLIQPSTSRKEILIKDAIYLTTFPLRARRPIQSNPIQSNPIHPYSLLPSFLTAGEWTRNERIVMNGSGKTDRQKEREREGGATVDNNLIKEATDWLFN